MCKYIIIYMGLIVMSRVGKPGCVEQRAQPITMRDYVEEEHCLLFCIDALIVLRSDVEQGGIYRWSVIIWLCVKICPPV